MNDEEGRWLMRRGFTLTEMLVALGIIVLMISLLLPAIVKARRASEMTKCLAQLRELGVATQAYMNDNEKTFADASFGNSADSPYSPRGMNDYGLPGYEANDPVPKKGMASPPAAFGQGVYCMPSIAQ